MESLQSVLRFIKESVVEPGLEINEIPKITPVHLSYVDFFEANGWKSLDVPDHPKHHRMFDPIGKEVVKVRGISATRHPGSTTKICRFKHFTKKMLDLAGVPSPVGAEFAPTEKDIAANYFDRMPKPVVVKPTNASSSHGVSVGVNSLPEFYDAWEYALASGNDRTKVLLEEFVQGVEVRAFVVGSQVVAAAVRIPPFVVGDGKSSMAELLEVERERRRVNKKVRANIIPDWEFVARFGHSADTVPSSGEIVILRHFSTTSLGALFFDITERLSEEIKQIAVNATAAIPHLEIAGIDMLIANLEDPTTAKILEINTTPATDLHRYPAFGELRPVEKYVADYYHSEYLRRG